jgi:hypothetical protein
MWYGVEACTGNPCAPANWIEVGFQIGRPFQCRWTDRNRSFLGRSADVCLDSRSALHYLAPSMARVSWSARPQLSAPGSTTQLTDEARRGSAFADDDARMAVVTSQAVPIGARATVVLYTTAACPSYFVAAKRILPGAKRLLFRWF